MQFFRVLGGPKNGTYPRQEARENMRRRGPTLLLGGGEQASHRVTVVAIVVVRRIRIRSIRVEVVHIVAIVPRRRPPVAVRTLIVRGPIVEVAREGQGEYATRKISTETSSLRAACRLAVTNVNFRASTT